mmetsp:Transcript_9740/g.14372  ORF Transcript_9740/g.14372 Transcript_9740/m.14372 type:complete len:393 (+) Transcript_9740:40-1218(+)
MGILPTNETKRIERETKTHYIIKWISFQIIIAIIGMIIAKMTSMVFEEPVILTHNSGKPFDRNDPEARKTNRKFIQHILLKRVRENIKEHKLELYLKNEKEVPKLRQPTKETFFHECVLKRRPCILKKVSDNWKATHQWNDNYFRRKIGKNKVSIEYTKGQRFYGDQGRQKLETMSVSEFLDEIRDEKKTRNLYLAETSIHEHFPELLKDIPEKYPNFIPPFLRHDVTQLWIGAGGQVTPIHNDEAENILCQFKGQRRFIIHPPGEVDLLYISEENPVYPQISKKRYQTLEYRKYPLYRQSREYVLRVREGECMYLPAYWYHEVESSHQDSLAINYWYHPFSALEEYLWRMVSGFKWRDPTDPEAPLIHHRKSGLPNNFMDDDDDDDGEAKG